MSIEQSGQIRPRTNSSKRGSWGTKTGISLNPSQIKFRNQVRQSLEYCQFNAYHLYEFVFKRFKLSFWHPRASTCFRTSAISADNRFEKQSKFIGCSPLRRIESRVTSNNAPFHLCQCWIRCIPTILRHTHNRMLGRVKNRIIHKDWTNLVSFHRLSLTWVSLC